MINSLRATCFNRRACVRCPFDNLFGFLLLIFSAMVVTPRSVYRKYFGSLYGQQTPRLPNQNGTNALVAAACFLDFLQVSYQAPSKSEEHRPSVRAIE